MPHLGSYGGLGAVTSLIARRKRGLKKKEPIVAAPVEALPPTSKGINVGGPPTTSVRPTRRRRGRRFGKR